MPRTVPRAVLNEVLVWMAAVGRPAAIAAGSIRIVENVWTEPAFPTLDEGEASTLRAALNQESSCLVIIDETAGRAVASELGLTVTGVVGVIITARRRGLIASAKNVFEVLRNHDFRLADSLIDAALKSLGEQ